MIVTDRLVVGTMLDRLYANNPDAREHAAHELARAIVLMAENVGYFAREESVWVEQATDITDGSLVLTAWWYPDPAAGVELRGGPNDGRLEPIPRGDDGRPAQWWRVTPEHTPPVIDTAAYPTDLPPRPAVYQRAGIDSVTDRWVYLFEG